MEKAYNTYYNKSSTYDLQGRTGSTNYIDFLHESEITNSVTYGLDKFSRKFIVIKIKVYLKDGQSVNCFQTFFQRYTNNCELWVGCGNCGLQLFTCGGMNNAQINVITELLKSGKADLFQENFHDYRFVHMLNVELTNPPILVELRSGTNLSKENMCEPENKCDGCEQKLKIYNSYYFI